MQRHHRTAATLLTAGLLATGCSGSSDQATPGPSNTASEKTSSIGGCVALLERNYQNGNPRDVSDEPACADLTEDEYTAAVSGVLAGHKDDFLADAEQQYVWDTAWEETSAEQQQVTCDRLRADGAEVVGQEMKEAAGGDSSGDEVAMAMYLLAEKC